VSASSSCSRPTSGAPCRASASHTSLHADEAVGRDRLGLALQLERLDLLDLDAVLDEPVRQLAEQDLALAGGLLEAGGDVDGVACDEPLAGRGVAGDDLARVDAGAVRELHAVDALQVAVERLECGLHPAAARTARSASSSCSRGSPKTAITASPMNFSITPP
jgi:hypothetical protein